MKLPEPPETSGPAVAPKSVLIMMVVVLVAMALISIYANVQRWRRDKVESVIVTPAASPAATP